MIARTEMFDPNPGYVPAESPRLTNRFGYIKLTVSDPSGRQLSIRVRFEALSDLMDSGYRILREEAAHLASECELDREISIP